MWQNTTELNESRSRQQHTHVHIEAPRYSLELVQPEQDNYIESGRRACIPFAQHYLQSERTTSRGQHRKYTA